MPESNYTERDALIDLGFIKGLFYGKDTDDADGAEAICRVIDFYSRKPEAKPETPQKLEFRLLEPESEEPSPTPAPMKSGPYSEEEAQAILRERESGSPFAAIAKMLGRSEGSVSQYYYAKLRNREGNA